MTIMKTCGVSKLGMIALPAVSPKLLKRKT
jgi:hypothetical protein